MFTDCLLDGDAMPVFNGSREEVREYIGRNQPLPMDYRVHEGFADKLMTVEEYMEVPDD